MQKYKKDKDLLYKILNAENKVIRVGITNDMTQRINDYFRQEWSPEICTVYVSKLSSECDAQMLETYYINMHKPKYNKQKMYKGELSVNIDCKSEPHFIKFYDKKNKTYIRNDKTATSNSNVKLLGLNAEYKSSQQIHHKKDAGKIRRKIDTKSINENTIKPYKKVFHFDTPENIKRADKVLSSKEHFLRNYNDIMASILEYTVDSASVIAVDEYGFTVKVYFIELVNYLGMSVTHDSIELILESLRNIMRYNMINDCNLITGYSISPLAYKCDNNDNKKIVVNDLNKSKSYFTLDIRNLYVLSKVIPFKKVDFQEVVRKLNEKIGFLPEYFYDGHIILDDYDYRIEDQLLKNDKNKATQEIRFIKQNFIFDLPEDIEKVYRKRDGKSVDKIYSPLMLSILSFFIESSEKIAIGDYGFTIKANIRNLLNYLELEYNKENISFLDETLKDMNSESMLMCSLDNGSLTSILLMEYVNYPGVTIEGYFIFNISYFYIVVYCLPLKIDINRQLEELSRKINTLPKEYTKEMLK